MNDNKDKDIFTEIEGSEYILNLNFYLHTALLEALKALGNGIKQDKVKEGLLNLTLSVSQAEGIAKAKNLLDFSDGEYKERLQEFKASMDSSESKLIQDAQIANFKLIQIMKCLDDHQIKHGKLII